MLRCCRCFIFLLLLVGGVIGQLSNTPSEHSRRYDTSQSCNETQHARDESRQSRYETYQSRYLSGPGSHGAQWSGSVQHAQSRTPSSRYDTYRPLDNYRQLYGSQGLDTRGQSVHHSSTTRIHSGASGVSSTHRHSSTGQQEERRTESGNRAWGRGNYGRRTSSRRVTPSPVPPTIESSTGLTHYGSLHQGRGRWRGQIRPPQTNPAARGGGGRPGQHVAGEGYGEAYLSWSEFGIGCTCDECGTRNCQHFSGDCECFDNVVGSSCDRCAQDHWGFASCQGCQPCQCNLASYSSQCDEGTGQCDCTEGVTGQRCDQCKPGFWNYTRNGCQECSCREGFSIGVGCNPRNGQCQCLPGVVGANCDKCPDRWVLIDGYGCQECEECVHSLLDTTDLLADLLKPTMDEFESAKYSYFLHQRLGVINSTIIELRPRVELLDLSESEALPLEEPLQNLLKEAQRMATQTELVGDRAQQASDDGFGVHVMALKVQEDVEAAFDLARRIIAEINKLVIGLETGTGAQLELAISEAEAIVAEMNERDFGLYNDKAEVEQELARELKESLEHFYYPIKTQQNATDDHEARLKMFAANLEEMRAHIYKAQQQTAEAQQMIRDNRRIGYQSMTNKLNKIEMLQNQADDSLREAEDLVDKARENYVNLTFNFDLLSTESERLRAGNSTLSEVVLTQLTELREAQELARDIPNHAQHLKTTAAELDDLLADTREVAENALSAANAYKNIVLAIEDAYNASLSANMTAARAVGMSLGVSDQALESQEESEEKQQLAITRVQRVEQDLRPQLENAQEDVRNLREMNDNIDNTLATIDRDLTAFEQESFSEEAERLKENAINSQVEADEAILHITNSQDRINEAIVEAKLLVKNLADSNRDIVQANELVTRVEQVVPEMTETAIRLEEQREVIQAVGIDVGDRLERLRNHIKQTRELSSKIRVGVAFQPSTTIELENPEDIAQAATATKVSLFFRTEDPNGLLLFLGTPTGGHQRMRRTTTDDFLALELDGGYVRLTINLGAGPYSIEHNRLFVADGEWTKVVVDRIGKVVRLSVEREDMETEPIEEVLPGRRSVFNLDPKVTKIFVGGIPAGVEVDRAVVSTSYLGDMEDLRINDQPLGLWNFMQNGTNDNRNRGSMARDRLVDLVPPTGLRFGGEGYAALNTTGYRFRRQFDLQLDFKTFAEDGILFMITGAPNQYMAVALEEGRLIFQYNLGSGLASMVSEGTYHDGQWHHIEVARQENRGVLKIGPGLETLSGASAGRGKTLHPVSDTMYFGGFPGEHAFLEVTNEDFHGCIDKVVVSSRPIDLSTSKATLGTVPGCPIQVANMVSFERSSPGYVRFGSPEGSGLQLVFKFKTDQPDGLILYASTRNQDSYLSLSLAEGALILRAAPGGELTTGSYDKYNDTEWHVVIASREDNELRLDIDDFKSYKVRVGEQAIPFDGPVFFGGVPEVFKISAAASATDTNFFGCLGDATLNGRIVNFAQTEDTVGAHLQKCPLQRVTSIFFEQNRDVSYPDTTTEYPLDSCALPEVPERETVDPAQGFRFDEIYPAGYTFGSKRSSRLELHSLPGNARADFKFSFEFKTRSNDSLIFYASSPSHRDYVTFYIKDGKIVFSFNAGTGKALMRSSESFNDGQWHSIIVERQGEDGVLVVDGYLKANATTSGDSKFIDIQPPFFYGGISQSSADMVRPNTEGTELSFNGCLRNLRMNNERMAGQHQAYGVLPCSENTEPGVFFGVGDRAHVILLKRFSVGRVFEMSMEIKPRKNSGVIASVHGRRDFVLLQMQNGTLMLSVDNGKGISTVVYKPPSPWSFCDGRWHYVKLIKNKNIALMVVDDITTSPATGKIGATSTDTRNPLFLGSQPFVTRRRGDATPEKYVGCIRNVYVNKGKLDLPYATFTGNVDAGSCPTI